MPASFSRFLFIALVVSLVAGCGTKSAKKGGGMTVQQRLEKAENESTPDKQAAGYLRAARAQLASGDTSGARDSARTAFDRLKGEGDASAYAPRLIDAAAFLAEIGDKTQIATVLLAANNDSLTQVIAGTTLGMMLANVPVVLLGKLGADKLPLKGIRIACAILFAGLGVSTLIFA
jgi:putative Ca2+/H+ antiporter (TMEM165/GDT1 family)